MHAPVAHHVPRDIDAKLVDIPERFDRAAALSASLLFGGRSSERAEISISAGTLRISSESDIGTAAETMPIADTHADVTVRVNPKLLLGCGAAFDKMWIGKGIMVLAKGPGTGKLYLIACRSDEEDAGVESYDDDDDDDDIEEEQRG